MTKFPSLSKQLTLLLIVLVLKLSIDFSQSATVAHPLFDDDAMVEEDNSGENLQRRADDLQKLRHFLLTSNAEQRASRRQQQDLSKRELIREYLRSLENSDSSQTEQVKKRFKAYCSSYEDVVNSDWAACG